jgi:hypothetical protein
MSFNWEVYNLLNPDLAAAGLNTPSQLHGHWLKWGKTEGRICNIAQAYPDFNHDFYRENYPDLVNMNSKELELHWLQWGKNEGRMFNIAQVYPDFNHDIYRKNYPDLAHMNNSQLESHWLQWGRHENRSYISSLFIKVDKYRNYSICYIDSNNSDKYFNDNIKVKHNELGELYNESNRIQKIDNGIYINTNYILYTNEIIYNIITHNKTSFISILDNKEYDIFQVNQFYNQDCNTVMFWCNKNDPFCIVQCSSYMDFFYFIHLNTKKIVQINNSTGGHVKYLDNIINNININSGTINVSVVKKYLYIGFNSNIGHHLWNEISGIYYFLSNPELIDKIDGIIIGPYDAFNIYSYLVENYNKKLEIIKQQANHTLNTLPHIPLYLNTFYINKNISKLFKNDIIDNAQKYDIELTFDIRTIYRILLNIKELIVYSVNNLLTQYPTKKIKINFTGRFITETQDINLNTDKEYLDQIRLVTEIIKSLPQTENIIYNNMIGQHLYTIFDNIKNSNLCICTAGTSSINLINWIYRKKLLCGGPKYCYNWKHIQYTVLDNNEGIYIPLEYITTHGDNVHSDYSVDIPKVYQLIVHYMQ